MSWCCSSVRPGCRGCGAGFVLRHLHCRDIPVGSPAVCRSGELGKSVVRLTDQSERFGVHKVAQSWHEIVNYKKDLKSTLFGTVIVLLH